MQELISYGYYDLYVYYLLLLIIGINTLEEVINYIKIGPGKFFSPKSSYVSLAISFLLVMILWDGIISEGYKVYMLGGYIGGVSHRLQVIGIVAAIFFGIQLVLNILVSEKDKKKSRVQ